MRIGKMLLVAGALSLLFLNACTLMPKTEQREPRIYDLGTPADLLNAPGGSVLVRPFTNSSGARMKTMIRHEDQSVENCEFYRWSQSPARLLTHYLRGVFVHNGAMREPAWILEGDILAFEGNAETKSVLLCADCLLSRGGRTEKFRITVSAPFPDGDLADGEKTGIAMTQAAGLFTEQIMLHMKKFG